MIVFINSYEKAKNPSYLSQDFLLYLYVSLSKRDRTCLSSCIEKREAVYERCYDEFRQKII